MAQTVVLTDIQKVALAISPKDAANEPATLDGVPVWSTSDATIVTVTAATDGLSAEAITTGALGTADVTVTGQGDLTGGGTDTVTDTVTFQVTASQASSLNVSAGVPEAR